MKTIKLVLLGLTISVSMLGQAKSPQLVFSALDEAYKTKNEASLKNIYLHETDKDKSVSNAAIKILLLKDELNQVYEKINNLYPEVLSKDVPMLGMILGIMKQPPYFTEKSKNAKISINGNEATSEYSTPKDSKGASISSKDILIKIKDQWFISPYQSTSDDGSNIIKMSIVIESAVVKGNELLNKNAGKQEFVDAFNEILKKL